VVVTVTPATIAVALGRTTPEPGSVTEQQWQMWIDDALMLIDVRKAKLEVVEALDPAALDYVVREAVSAQVRRPDDATQVTVSVDDGSTSRTYRSARGRVEIIDEWWALLGLTPPTGGAFSVNMAPAFTAIHLPWCDLNMGGTSCSCGADIAGYPIYELY
jgi:rhodanese-related sulfurtransferase